MKLWAMLVVLVLSVLLLAPEAQGSGPGFSPGGGWGSGAHYPPHPTPDRKQCQWLEGGNENWRNLARVSDLPFSRCVAEASGHSSELLLPYLSARAVQREATWVSHTTGAWSVATGKKAGAGFRQSPSYFSWV